MAEKDSYISSIGRLVAGRNAQVLGSRALLHSMYPSDFEYYMLALELLDSNEDTQGYIAFPVMPSSLQESYAPLTTIENTLNGISVVGTDKFIPIRISIEGTFGVHLKVLMNKSNKRVSAYNNIKRAGTSLIGDDLSYYSDFAKVNEQESKITYSPRIKTGWGTVKLLESIVKKSETLDKSKIPHVLCLYNSATNNNYVVKVNDFDMSINESNYNVWRYKLTLTAVAPLEWYLKTVVKRHNPAGEAMALSAIQDGATDTAYEILKYL